MTPEQKNLNFYFNQKKRQDSNFNQTTFAKAMGMSQPAISQYSSGAVPLNTDFIIKAATILNISPTDIDPSLQKVLILNKQRRTTKVINTNKKIEAYTTESSLGYEIPNDSFAPRYLQGDIIIFNELSPQKLPPDLLLILYNSETFLIGKSLSDHTITSKNTIITPPYTGWKLGLIESIIPNQ